MWHYDNELHEWIQRYMSYRKQKSFQIPATLTKWPKNYSDRHITEKSNGAKNSTIKTTIFWGQPTQQESSLKTQQSLMAQKRRKYQKIIAKDILANNSQHTYILVEKYHEVV